MKVFFLNTISKIIVLSIVSYFIYFLLVEDNFLHSSISSIIAESKGLDENYHLLVFAFLPFYIGFVIYGLTMLGVYLRPIVQNFIIQLSKTRRPLKKPSQKCSILSVRK